MKTLKFWTGAKLGEEPFTLVPQREGLDEVRATEDWSLVELERFRHVHIGKEVRNAVLSLGEQDAIVRDGTTAMIRLYRVGGVERQMQDLHVDRLLVAQDTLRAVLAKHRYYPWNTKAGLAVAIGLAIQRSHLLSRVESNVLLLADSVVVVTRHSANYFAVEMSKRPGRISSNSWIIAYAPVPQQMAA